MTDRVNQVLRLPAGDPNYAGGLSRLTDDELRYCWDHETRTGGLRQIMREIKRRLAASQGKELVGR